MNSASTAPSAIGCRESVWLFCGTSAVAMMLGWGLRGFIGGGPLGAMIPGAMIGLLLCLLLRLDERTGAALGALGAIGIGLGGQMTYGQTIGFINVPETYWWGLFGLAVKGGVWGLSGGALLALGLILRQLTRKEFSIAFLIMLAGVVVGWKLIDEPRVIYFSNRNDKPREEILAGLLFGTIALLAYLASRGKARLPLHFALWGALGGAIGFGGGGLWIAAGKQFPAAKGWASWWKFMEFTFGFCFGLTLGLAAWLRRGFIRSSLTSTPETTPTLSGIPQVLMTCLLALLVLWIEMYVDMVCAFTFFGVVVLLMARFWEALSLQIALTITASAFVYDLIEKTIEETGRSGPLWKWSGATLTALVLSMMVVQRQRHKLPTIAWALLILTWLGVIVSYLKSLKTILPFNSHTIVELIFTVSAIALTWVVVKRLAGETPAPSGVNKTSM